MKKYILFLAFTTLLCGCDMFEYHPYDVRIKEKFKDTNRKNIQRIEAECRDKKSIKFALIGDSQRWYDETEAFVSHINKRDDVDFIVHGGDISDFGLKKEMEWIHDIMARSRIPYVTIIGNHDILGNGMEVYKYIYGEPNFAFTAGRTRFVCLNTNALEFNYATPVPDFLFIENQIKESQAANIDRTVVAMHAQPFCEQFNNNVANVFQKYLHQMKGLAFCLHAHTHTMCKNDLFNDGIIYYGSAAMNDRIYMLFTLNEEGFSYEVVEY